MLKKICCVAVALLCLLPSVSFANDAGPFLDKDENLSVKVELKSTEAQIGGTLDFTITLTNNTEDSIGFLGILRVFKNTALCKNIDGEYGYGAEISFKPHSTVEWDISADVLENIYWYKKNGVFYADFSLCFDYYSCTEDDDWGVDYYYESKTIPIKITNLNDGADFLNIVTVENEDSVYFGFEYYSDYDSSISDVRGEIVSDISITNTSGFELKDLIIRKDNGDNNKVYSLKPQENIRTSFEYTYWMEESEVPKEIPLSLTTVFTINNKYYAVEHSKNMPAEFIDVPKLELTFTSDENKPNHYSLSVKNVSGKEYTNFYFDIDSSSSFLTNNLIDTFANNQTFNSGLFDTDDTGFLNVIYGYIEDDKLFAWYASYYYIAKDDQTEEIDTLYFLQPINFIDGKFVNDEPSPSSTLEPTITPAASPSISPTQLPTPTVTSMPEPSPTPTSTPAVTVNSITKKAAVPLWVWIVLGCALLGTGLLSILINIMRIKKEKD